MAIFDVYRSYESVADADTAINWVNNGSFMYFNQSLAVVEDTGLTRRGEDKNTFVGTPTRQEYDVCDPTFYKKTTFSFNIGPNTPENSSKELVGSWKFDGVGSITVNPAQNGVILPSFDGGNLLMITSTRSGTITTTQNIEYFYPLLSNNVTVALSGRKIQGTVKIELSLVFDDTDAVKLETQSQFFGSYRRFSKTGVCPEKAKSAKVVVKATGTGAWSVGLSGISLVMGSFASLPATPSLADSVLPKGLTIMTLGDACPSGFTEVGADGRMALTTSGPSNFFQKTTDGAGNTKFIVEQSGGYDEHDHNPDGQVDCLEEPSISYHEGPDQVPADGYTMIHGVPYHLSGVITSWYPDDRPSVTLSTTHAHRFNTKMAAVPSNFAVKYCKKL